MAAILLKVFSAVMSVVVTLSGAFPVLFGNKVYLDPATDAIVLGGEFLSQTYVDEPIVISDLETAEKIFNEEECGEINEKVFEKNNIVCIPVVIPSTNYKVFVNGVAEKGDTVEVEYKLVSDLCIGAMMISHATICVAVSKNIKNIDVTETKMVVPFCIHEV